MRLLRNASNADSSGSTKGRSKATDWLPDMDLNHDKQIQSLLCYRYTIGQTGAFKVRIRTMESRKQLRTKSQISNPKSQIPKHTFNRL